MRIRINPGAWVANTLWLASGIVKARRFENALGAPDEAQDQLLRRFISKHKSSDYGKRHEFGSIRNRSDFARQVPIVSYEDMEPDIARIARGDRNVLTADRVTHLAPTSGSSGPRKLIPFTAGLTAAFNAAVFPWLHDLATQRPQIRRGPAYWSISPLAAAESEDSSVPIGFADDAEYLGGIRAWLVRKALAVPSSVRHARDPEMFWNLTLTALLRARDLRLISIWHPSFLDLLVQHASRNWSGLVNALNSNRAQELRAIGPERWTEWWPRLQVISCWGEQAAEPGWRALANAAPHVLVQAKGLMATECAVTIPLGDVRPLAVTSHYFEFLDEQGSVRGAYQLERGGRYEVIVTNGGGLWRYRLGDLVECTGHLRATPSLRFLGRAGHVSDLRGEKLSEPFVAEVLEGLWSPEERPRVAALRATDTSGLAAYELVISSDSVSPAGLGDRADRALQRNPHYALARRLGQLGRVHVVPLNPGAELDPLRQRSVRLGDVKPSVLLSLEENPISTTSLHLHRDQG